MVTNLSVGCEERRHRFHCCEATVCCASDQGYEASPDKQKPSGVDCSWHSSVSHEGAFIASLNIAPIISKAQ